jgi:hypothetical protein
MCVFALCRGCFLGGKGNEKGFKKSSPCLYLFTLVETGDLSAKWQDFYLGYRHLFADWAEVATLRSKVVFQLGFIQVLSRKICVPIKILALR